MAKTKIVVIHLKEIIYTAIFAALGILLILLLIFMFSGKNKSDEVSKDNIYTPGVWTSAINLNNTILNLEVIVDKNKITSVQVSNLEESVTTMYPLIQPSIESIALQLCNDVPIDEINLTEESSYTETFLINEIKKVLEKASVKE